VVTPLAILADVPGGIVRLELAGTAARAAEARHQVSDQQVRTALWWDFFVLILGYSAALIGGLLLFPIRVFRVQAGGSSPDQRSWWSVAETPLPVNGRANRPVHTDPVALASRVRKCIREEEWRVGALERSDPNAKRDCVVGALRPRASKPRWRSDVIASQELPPDVRMTELPIAAIGAESPSLPHPIHE
jgi:hypothetical protein